MRIFVLNGPNLNLIGTREPDRYGGLPFRATQGMLKVTYKKFLFHYLQSNVEGDLVTALHKGSKEFDGIIFNAGAYAHTSIALHDAIKAIEKPVVEVHITNIFAREEFRHRSIISSACIGTISGFGMSVYRLAVEALIDYYINKNKKKNDKQKEDEDSSDDF